MGGALDFWHLPSNCKFKASFSEWCLARARICSLTEHKLPLIVQEDCPPVSPLIKHYMAPNRKSSTFLDLLLKSLSSSDVRLSVYLPQFPQLLAKTLQPGNKVAHTTDGMWLGSIIIAHPTLLPPTTNNYCPPFYFSPNFNAVQQLQSKICPVIIGME